MLLSKVSSSSAMMPSLLAQVGTRMVGMQATKAQCLLLPSAFSSLRLTDTSPTSNRSFHTLPPLHSRIKLRHTHKPFWQIKQLAKASSDPVTPEVREFLDEMKDKQVRETRIGAVAKVSPLRDDLAPWPLGSWNDAGHNTRVGVIARKIGQQVMWTKKGKKVTATMLQVEDNHVIKYLSAEEYANTIVGEKLRRPKLYGRTVNLDRGCLVVGALSGDPEKFTKNYCGLFTDAGVTPKKILTRFPVTDNAILQPGTPLNASHFTPGQFIDVRGTSARRGFQGVMKRWGFSGMPKAHGVRKSHRRAGCTGSGRAKHRVWPKQKLPGHMGGDSIKMSGLQILRINYEDNILYVRGHAIPGEPGEIVHVKDTTLGKKRFTSAPRFFPTSTMEQHESLPEEEYADEMHRFEDPTITFTEQEEGKQ